MRPTYQGRQANEITTFDRQQRFTAFALMSSKCGCGSQYCMLHVAYCILKADEGLGLGFPWIEMVIWSIMPFILQLL